MARNSKEKRIQMERRREIRKEKSRDAARNRRGKESEIFADLIDALPVPDFTKSTLDKAGIMRLSVNYMKMRDFLKDVWKLEWGNSNSTVALKDILDTLQGFVLVVTPSGDIIYATENIKNILGLSQVDVIGNHVTEFTHPCDTSELLGQLKGNSTQFSVFSRFKSTILPKGRIVNIKSASHKVVRFTGQRLHADAKVFQNSDNAMTECIILNAHLIAHPLNIEEPLDTMTFATKHNMDMTFTAADEHVKHLTGYEADQLMGNKLYTFVHGVDALKVEQAFKTLYGKGQCMTEPYKVLTYGGGYIYMVTQATVITNGKDSQTQHIVCVHYVLSNIEEKDVILAEVQVRNRPRVVDKRQEIIAATAGVFEDLQQEQTSPTDILATTASVFSAENLADDILSTTASVFDDVPSSTDWSNQNQGLEELVAKLDSDIFDLNEGLVVDASSLDQGFGDDADLFFRAPYIPMNTVDDVNIKDDLLQTMTWDPDQSIFSKNEEPDIAFERLLSPSNDSHTTMSSLCNSPNTYTGSSPAISIQYGSPASRSVTEDVNTSGPQSPQSRLSPCHTQTPTGHFNGRGDPMYFSNCTNDGESSPPQNFLRFYIPQQKKERSFVGDGRFNPQMGMSSTDPHDVRRNSRPPGPGDCMAPQGSSAGYGDQNHGLRSYQSLDVSLSKAVEIINHQRSSPQAYSNMELEKRSDCTNKRNWSMVEVKPLQTGKIPRLDKDKIGLKNENNQRPMFHTGNEAIKAWMMAEDQSGITRVPMLSKLLQTEYPLKYPEKVQQNWNGANGFFQ